MGLYSKPALDLLGALINRDNPNLKITLSSDNIMLLGGPYTTGLGTSGRNSRVVINGKTGSNIVGKMEFFYDRLNIGDLFKNITVVFDGAGSATKVSDLLPALNEQYGIHLTADDITTPNTAVDFAYSPTPVTLTISATCIAYRGTLNITWRRKPVGMFPDSGPGPKTMLIGSLDAGYFGKVGQDELMSQGEFYSKFFSDRPKGAAIPVIDSAMFWLKFAIGGKFVFFPSHNLVYSISWDTLDSYGAVNANMPYPMAIKKENKNHFFQLRLPRFGDADEMGPVRGDPTSDAVKLFNNVHKQGYGVGSWDALTTLNLTEYFMWANKRNDVAAPYPAFLSQMNQSGVSTIVTSTGSYWRPVLVLVDGALILMPVDTVIGVAAYTVKAPVLTINKERDPLMLVRMIDVAGTYLRAFSKPRLWVPVPNPIMPVSNVAITSTIKRFPVKITIETDKRISLSQANGELDGFR